MNKRIAILIGVLVVVVIGGGWYYLMNKTSSPSATSADSSTVPAVNNAVLLTKTSSSLGQYLTDPSGKALYTYGGDSAGVSNCTGNCLATWPAYVDSGSTSNLPSGVSTITRKDNGKVQFTYNGMPLYYFVADILGHVNGNGVSGFKIAKPAATAAATPAPNAAAASSSSGSSW